MLDLAKTNKKYSLKQETFYRVKKYYMSLYKTSLLKMWDMGYTSEISIFKESDFIQAYADEGINLKFLDGKVILKPWVFHLEWLLSNRENDFYYYMKELLEYREACNSIDRVYDSLKIYKVKATKTISWGTVFNYQGFVGSSRLVRLDRYSYSLLVEKDNYLKEVPHNTVILKAISKLLNTDAEKVEILDGVRLADLDNYLEDTLFGGIVLNKTITDLLSSGVSPTSSIYDVSYSLQEEILSEIEEYTSKQEGELLGLDNSSIYFSVPKDRSYREKVSFGAFSIDYDSGKVLPSLNNYHGITGDYVSMSSPIFSVDGYQYVGCPIYLTDFSGKESLYLDVEQVGGLGESSLLYDLDLRLDLNPKGTYKPIQEVGLLDFYVNSAELSEEGVFTRYLVGNHSEEAKLSAMRKAASLFGG